MQTLVRDVEKLWNHNKPALEKRISDWVNGINQNKKVIETARKTFHEWEPLRVYTSVTRLKDQKRPPSFSLRFLGQEVAVIKVYKNGTVKLNVTKDLASLNEHYFGLVDKGGINVDWNSKEATEFRNYFKLIQKQKRKTRSPEHQVETEIIKKMKGTPSKSGIDSIQPVVVAGCPLQFPSPITGSTGTPKFNIAPNSGGGIDILARREKGRTKLSVWELKRPGLRKDQLEKAIKQSIIYASTLRMMLRSSSGQAWYKLFGFNGCLPEKLKIEAVAAIAQKDINKFEQAKNKLQPWSSLLIGNDSILPYVAYYDDQTYKVQQPVLIK